MPSNKHASIYTESNTLPPLIIISQVHFMSLEATPLLALHSLTRRSISTTKFYVPSNMHASIYTESNTLPPLITISQVHFMNLEATPLLTLDSLTTRSASINIPLQPNFTCPQTSMQAFLTLYYHAAKSTS